MMLKKYFLSILPLIALLISCTQQHSKIVLAEYGDYKIYMEDFERAYAKNTGGIEKAKTDSLQQYKSFLDLYLNFKMKLRDAVVRGYLSEPEMQQELIDYKINIGKTVYLEDKLYKPALREIYEKRKTEINAAHIMLIQDSVYNSDEKLEELGNQLIDRINRGEDFGKLVREYSKDMFSKERDGVVGWVTAGQIVVPEIEYALYNTEPGKIYPKLLKTTYGYHIIKVINKQPRKNKIRAQHILTLLRDSTGNIDSARAYTKILEVQNKLNKGEDFGELAQSYSEDKSTATQKGDLGFFSRGNMVPKFEDAAFALKVGEVSPIIQTEYGYHIIKLLEVAPYPSFQESAEELKEMFQRTSYKNEYTNLLNKLKAELGFKLNENTYQSMVTNIDSVKTGIAYDESWLKKELGSKTIVHIINQPYTVDSLMNYLNKNGLYLGRKFDSVLLNEAIDQLAAEILLKEKALNYDKEEPSFAQLMEDYENGIYLFKILEEEVWSKVKIDSVMTQNYFDKHRENYKWKDRVEFKEVYVINDSLANHYYQQAISGVDFDTLVAKYSQRKGYEKTPGYFGLVEVDFNELAIQANNLKNINDISKPFAFQNGFSFVKLIKRENARLKNYDEVKTEISSLLQELESKRMEEAYIQRLKSIYKPKVYYDELNNAFKN